jgi:hypothetical protein
MLSLISESPRGSTSVLEGYIQPNFGHALRVWWAFYWPTFIISIIITFWLGVLAKWLLRTTDSSRLILGLFLFLAAIVLPCLAGVFIMQYILRKDFRHFRIALTTRWREGQPQQPLPPTFERALRVWWTYAWRTFIYDIVAFAVMMIPSAAIVGILSLNHELAMVAPFVLDESIKAVIALYVIHAYILDEDMGDFRVCLLPRVPSPAPYSGTAPDAVV